MLQTLLITNRTLLSIIMESISLKYSHHSYIIIITNIILAVNGPLHSWKVPRKRLNHFTTDPREIKLNIQNRQIKEANKKQNTHIHSNHLQQCKHVNASYQISGFPNNKQNKAPFYNIHTTPRTKLPITHSFKKRLLKEQSPHLKTGLFLLSAQLKQERNKEISRKS